LAPDGFAAAPYHGIAEIWFDDIGGFRPRRTREVVKPDGMKFVYRSKALFMFTETVPMIGGVPHGECATTPLIHQDQSHVPDHYIR
jgi:hypothetical protein